jgi:undecaprenyl-diphosphatase
MDIIQAIAFGLVQGLGEFLPISSSAHLVILPWLFNWEDPGLAFNVALHGGTLLALLWHFRADLMIFPSALKRVFSHKLPWGSFDLGERTLSSRNRAILLRWLVIGTLPAAAVGLTFHEWFETFFRHPLSVAAAMTLLGLLLWFADEKGKKSRDFSELKIRDVILIGLFQALALIPGVSRSGATITCALFLGLNRTAATEFSFYLSIPAIVGALILEGPAIVSSLDQWAIWGALFLSFLSGLWAIRFLLKLAQASHFKGFTIYRIVFSLVVLGLWWMRGV